MDLATYDLFTPLQFSFLYSWVEADCTISSETDKLKQCDAVGLILEFADHLCICQSVKKMFSSVVRGVVLTQIFSHVFIDIFGFDVIT